MLGSLLLLFVLGAIAAVAASFAGPPSQARLAAGLAGWLVLELLAALVTWALAGLDTWGGDAGVGNRDLAWGAALCAALLVVPFLQVRRYRRRGR